MLEKLLKEIEQKLCDEIPKRVSAAKLPGCYSHALLQLTGVDTDSGGFTPPIILHERSMTEQIIRETPNFEGYRSEIWAISGRGGKMVPSSDRKLDQLLDEVFQLTIAGVEVNNYAPVRRMFQHVCSRLNSLDWSKLLDVTNYFVIVPADSHGEFDPSEDGEACLPKDKIHLLKQHGLIGK